MNGETSIHEDSTFDRLDPTQNLHADLFSIWNLILSADQAMSHGYRLNDVSLCEERTIASILSHKIKSDRQMHLFAFVLDNDWNFQESLNTLEFSLKFQSTFNTARVFNSFHSSDEE